MTQEETISWIFLAIALASKQKLADINAISMIADGINHAVPTQKELQVSISWLIENNLIVKYEKSYELTPSGMSNYAIASEKTDKLLAIWKNLEIIFKSS
jgi:hypothetical protein